MFVFFPKSSPGMVRTPRAIYFRLYFHVWWSPWCTGTRLYFLTRANCELSSWIHVQWPHTGSLTSVMEISKRYKSRCFVLFLVFSCIVKHLLAQRAKDIDSPYREAPCVLAWPSQSSGSRLTFWGQRWGSQGWDLPTSELSIGWAPSASASPSPC